MSLNIITVMNENSGYVWIVTPCILGGVIGLWPCFPLQNLLVLISIISLILKAYEYPSYLCGRACVGDTVQNIWT